MRNLIALKPFRYATRMLRPGDGFMTKSDRDAKLLIAVGKARSCRIPGKIDPPPDEIVQQITPERVATMRVEYLELLGKRPFHGWDADELQRRIDEALAS